MADRLIVDVYPVGLLADLLMLRRALRLRQRHGILWSLSRILACFRYMIFQAKRRNWRAVKNTCNGYLAEPQKFPPGSYRRRAGSGWTKARALRSLRRHLPADPCRDMSTWEVPDA